jgi:hypothetical protein
MDNLPDHIACTHFEKRMDPDKAGEWGIFCTVPGAPEKDTCDATFSIGRADRSGGHLKKDITLRCKQLMVKEHGVEVLWDFVLANKCFKGFHNAARDGRQGYLDKQAGTRRGAADTKILKRVRSALEGNRTTGEHYISALILGILRVFAASGTKAEAQRHEAEPADASGDVTDNEDVAALVLELVRKFAPRPQVATMAAVGAPSPDGMHLDAPIPDNMDFDTLCDKVETGPIDEWTGPLIRAYFKRCKNIRTRQVAVTRFNGWTVFKSGGTNLVDLSLKQYNQEGAKRFLVPYVWICKVLPEVDWMIKFSQERGRRPQTQVSITTSGVHQECVGSKKEPPTREFFSPSELNAASTANKSTAAGGAEKSQTSGAGQSSIDARSMATKRQSPQQAEASGASTHSGKKPRFAEPVQTLGGHPPGEGEPLPSDDYTAPSAAVSPAHPAAAPATSPSWSSPRATVSEIDDRFEAFVAACDTPQPLLCAAAAPATASDTAAPDTAAITSPATADPSASVASETLATTFPANASSVVPTSAVTCPAAVSPARPAAVFPPAAAPPKVPSPICISFDDDTEASFTALNAIETLEVRASASAPAHASAILAAASPTGPSAVAAAPAATLAPAPPAPSADAPSTDAADSAATVAAPAASSSTTHLPETDLAIPATQARAGKPAAFVECMHPACKPCNSKPSRAVRCSEDYPIVQC